MESNTEEIYADCYGKVKKKYRDDKKDWYVQIKKNMVSENVDTEGHSS